MPNFNKNQAHPMYLFEMRLLCDCVTVTMLLQVHENLICVYFSYRVAFKLPKLDFLYVTL